VSDRRKYLILMGAIVAALIGAVLLIVPGSPIHKKAVLGLDLRGGLEVVLKAVPPKGHTLTADDMSRSISIMQNRINKLGVSEPEIRKQGANQIVIQLAGVHDPATAAALIGKTAQLMLFDFENDLTGPSRDVNGNPIASPSLYALLTQVKKQAAKGSPQSYYLFRTTKKTTPAKTKKGKPTVTVEHSLIGGPADTLKELLRPFGGKVPPHGTVLAVPERNLVVSCPVANGCLGITQNGVSKNGVYYYLLKYDPQNKTAPVPEMNGSDLVLSGTRADFGQAGNPIVLLQFTGHGSNQFQKITRQEAQRGQAKYNLAGKQGDYLNYVQHFAIVLDGVLQSTPYIDFKQNPGGIPGAYAQIDMGSGGTFQDAKNLALVLQTGALPFRLVQVSQRAVH
jgi:protein-export membrane protein SecD